ncbi:MAG TPA: hypothetical protein VM142_05635, partial [Acidimicrobiales bacterium]|nr:hypothetical protein [Acidimicrobiales bacterium]
RGVVRVGVELGFEMSDAVTQRLVLRRQFRQPRFELEDLLGRAHHIGLRGAASALDVFRTAEIQRTNAADVVQPLRPETRLLSTGG